MDCLRPRPHPHPEGELKPQVRFPSLPGVEPHRRARGRLSNGARFGRKERKSRSEIEIVFTSDDSGDERDRRKTREEGRRVGDFFALASGLPRRWVAKQTGTPGRRAARCRRLCPLSQSVSAREKEALSHSLSPLAVPLSPRAHVLSRAADFSLRYHRSPMTTSPPPPPPPSSEQ